MSCTQLNYFKWIKSGCPQHCVKSVRIRSFSVPYFPALRLNMEIYSKSSYSVQKRGKTKHYLHNINQKENSKIIPSLQYFSGPSSFSGPYFRSFGLNTEILSVNLYIHSKCGKKRTRKIPNTDTIYTTLIRAFFQYLDYLAVTFSRDFFVEIRNGTKMEFSVKDFFSKCDQIRSFLRIWSHLLKKSLMKNFIFCEVNTKRNEYKKE